MNGGNKHNTSNFGGHNPHERQGDTRSLSGVIIISLHPPG